jgi:hypothetical protein
MQVEVTRGSELLGLSDFGELCLSETATLYTYFFGIHELQTFVVNSLVIAFAMRSFHLTIEAASGPLIRRAT